MDGHRKLKVKYLGSIIDDKLTFKNPCQEAGRKAIAVKKKLHFHIGRKSALNFRHKLTPIRSIILTYASIAWGHTTKTTREILQLQDNVCAVNAPWYIRNRVIFRDLEQTSIIETMRIRERKPFAKLGNHPNKHLHELLD